ncbi:hypothetical protein JIN87_26575 [Pelagicoccus mobilis]|uniref:Uncharacterized protein n=2 Tax=Pelagicoccus mobilis TaxID=415221 RepID=A0A934RZD2_9BACT|nr:hypothetical protein [Pelagicoccus mobilis]
MLSESLEPANDLSLIVKMKASGNGHSVKVVSDTVNWLLAQLLDAGVEASSTPCQIGVSGVFSTIAVAKDYQGSKYTLTLKIAAIRGNPYVSSEVSDWGNCHHSHFPFYGDVSSDEEKQNLLHYISDFLA